MAAPLPMDKRTRASGDKPSGADIRARFQLQASSKPYAGECRPSDLCRLDPGHLEVERRHVLHLVVANDLVLSPAIIVGMTPSCSMQVACLR